ncbi:hypothetical protein CDN99_04430 [Roseateles aquatilis]|uniref:Uncharacterized protein n=1 Tax=Roseateles aquatilis TaxID=431061 RepID=A0A246JM23_9BURK|nr:hypothetical protein [Roseateles aquatilis]OWQ93704.1 hypothetical protein CDN99_04430 [Roseateles aquatilis]
MTAVPAPLPVAIAHRIQLLPNGLRIDGLPELRSRLLPRLLAALLQAHEQGLARIDSPCTRAELCQRITGMAELHRTQVWRALALLADGPLAALIEATARSSGPFWLNAALLTTCHFDIEGTPATGAELARWLGQQRPVRAPAAEPLLPLAYAEALARADYLLDRGELYPARLALQQAAPHVPDGDASAAAALGLRRARIARRLGDWAALQDELRDLGQALNNARFPRPERRQLRARVAILAAWHWYGSLGQPAAALDKLDEVEPEVLATDSSLRCEHGNLRGIVLRELAVARGDAALAQQALASLGDALRHASLAGLPDTLQVCAANLSNALGQLAEARLLPTDGPGVEDALRWLLLSDALCARWQLGRSSLLNTIFLLRLAALGGFRFDALQRLATGQGLPLPASSYGELAAQRWAACRARQSQIPADQRCAFLLLWARHALDEGDAFTATDLVRQARVQARKLRDEQARRRYLAEADALMPQSRQA